MSFTCNDCKRTVKTVADIRGCTRCRAAGNARTIPERHVDSDTLSPTVMAMIMVGAFSPHHAEAAPATLDPEPERFQGGGGEFSGAGSSGSYDSSPSDSSPADSGGGDSGGSSGGGE